MGKFALLGIRYDNPQQIDQSTLNWEKGLILTVNPSRLQLGRHIPQARLDGINPRAV